METNVQNLIKNRSEEMATETHEIVERFDEMLIVKNCPNFKDKNAKITAGKVYKDGGYYMCTICGEKVNE